ncbi:hypothetical protein SFRURICE_016884, partial [Spodoptera frugiperda]
MHITARNAAIQCTHTFHYLCYKSQVIWDSVLLLRNFRKAEKSSNTLSVPGIKPETHCPVVALANTRSTKQSISNINALYPYYYVLSNVQRHAFYPRRGRQRCTLLHVMPLYNLHSLFTICVRCQMAFWDILVSLP